MTCHHKPGDTGCSSHPDNVRSAERLLAAERTRLLPATPDATQFQIEDVVRVGPHLVIKALYPNCAKCSFEGRKVMVFLNVTETEAIRWRKIDPHFRAPTMIGNTEAPGPAARFPASAEGWQDALDYAARKVRT